MLTALKLTALHLLAGIRSLHDDETGGLNLAEGMAIAVFGIVVAVAVFDQLGILGTDIVTRIRQQILGP